MRESYGYVKRSAMMNFLRIVSVNVYTYGYSAMYEYIYSVYVHTRVSVVYMDYFPYATYRRQC